MKVFYNNMWPAITRRLAALLAWLTAALAATHPVAAQTLNAVKQHGALVCGVNENLLGFSAKNGKGEWSGFDVDFCRALAAAIFNDPTKVEFVVVSAQERFSALQSGKVDILSRNSTWTMAREAKYRLIFPAVTYYDGQGFLVRRSMGLQSIRELKSGKVCVQANTTSVSNAADYFRSNSIEVDLVIGSNASDLLKAYESDVCNVFTSDVSLLYAQRLNLATSARLALRNRGWSCP
jgi:general L-amino acid transport system substrate-binding protein